MSTKGTQLGSSPLTLTAAADVVSGQVVKVGELIGVVIADALSGQPMEVDVEGVFELTKVTADDVSEGEELYWDAGASKLTVVPGANILAGAAVEAAAASTATTVKIRLNGKAGNKKMTNQAAVATADGSDAGTTQTLANALKVAHNALLVKLKAAGLMVAD